MSDKHNNLIEKEIEDLQNILIGTLKSVCDMADKYNIDRDSMLEYFADRIKAFAAVASIQNYNAHRTNADRIRNMSDEELMEFLSHIRSGHDVNYGDFINLGYGIVLTSHDTDIESRISEWLQSEAE